jgi:hypothetical protein
MRNYLTLLSISILLVGFSHPLYLSNTVIKYEEGRKALNVRVQIFEEDIAEIMMIGHGVDIMKNGDRPEIQKYVDEYIWHNLKLNVDGRDVKDFKLDRKSTRLNSSH